MKTNVVFEYAGENMETVHDKVAVTGEITDCGFAVMMAATNRDGVFVPAAVGLRKVNYAKLVGVEPCEADSDAVCSADVLVGRFVNASGAWDELSSNRQVQSGAVRVGIPFVYGLYNFTPVRNGANKKISWWISREGIGHALYCFTANYTPEIGYQFQHISNYISMFEEQFGTPDGKPKSKKAPVGGRNVAVVRIKVYPDVGPAYIVEVPSDEIGSIDKWAREHLENWTCVEQKDSNSAPEASPSPEIGYQFQYISNVGGRNVDAIRFKVYPNVGPAYIVEVPSGEVDNIDEWLSEHMESDATFVELKSTDSTSKNTSSDENADIHEDGCDDFCSKCDAGCTASVADKTSEAGRYMVFTDSPYVRDAQIYCGTIDEDIYSEENEDNWYDTSGPVLLVDRDFKTLDELRKTVLNIYPDMDLCTLRAIRVSAETVCL